MDNDHAGPPSPALAFFAITDVVRLIFDRLDGRDLINLQKTCRSFDKHVRLLKDKLTPGTPEYRHLAQGTLSKGGVKFSPFMDVCFASRPLLLPSMPLRMPYSIVDPFPDTTIYTLKRTSDQGTALQAVDSAFCRMLITTSPVESLHLLVRRVPIVRPFTLANLYTKSSIALANTWTQSLEVHNVDGVSIGDVLRRLLHLSGNTSLDFVVMVDPKPEEISEVGTAYMMAFWQREWERIKEMHKLCALAAIDASDVIPDLIEARDRSSN